MELGIAEEEKIEDDLIFYYLLNNKNMIGPIYAPCTNQVTGETFQPLQTDDQNVFSMKWSLQPSRAVPFEHIHIRQDEIFEVQGGDMTIIINGEKHIVSSGNSITVPRGISHTAYNTGSSVLNCIVHYTPCLDQTLVMRCFLGLIRDGFLHEDGTVDIQRMGYFLMKMRAQSLVRPTFIHPQLLQVALRFFYIRGLVSGWDKLYEKYTGHPVQTIQQG